MSAHKFFTEIAILRGVAILAVLLYHLKTPFINSGYLGVDIFFVISGFLMAALYSDILEVKGRIGHFYKKRANRILPAYFVTLFAVTVFSALIVLPHELHDILKHHIWSVFFMPNVGFWTESSYFEGNQFKPFLNFWSLGVELQFYAIFPLIIWVFKRSKYWIIFGALASFALCFYMADLSPKTAFFMMPCRIWQFLLGFFTALYLAKENKNPKTYSPIFGLVALLALLGTMAFSFSQTAHLQYGSLIVSLLTIAVITCKLPQTLLNGRIGKGLQLLGTYSYSIYLVHFPVIAFFLYEPFGGLALAPMEPLNILAALIITALLSLALFHGVETLFRKGILGKKTLPAYMLAGGALLTLAFLLPSIEKARFSKQDMLVFNAWQDRSVYRCGKIKRLTQPIGTSCRLSEDHGENAQNYLLVGDSHADAIKETLRALADERQINLRLMKDNCNLGERDCAADRLKQEINRHNIKAIIMHSTKKDMSAKQIQTFLKAAPENVNIVLIAPVPVWDFHAPKEIYKAQKDGSDIWDHHASQTKKDYEGAHTVLFREIKAIKNPRLHVIELSGALCRPQCQIRDEQGRLLYFDSHHLTLTGADFIRNRLADVYDN